MSSITIVTHAYAKILPQYAVFLRAQLSSLYLYPTQANVKIIVCYTPDDGLVFKVLADFIRLDMKLDLIPLPEDKLFRRSIGRNIAALESESTLVWFADVDYYFGEGCLDSLQTSWSALPFPKPAMVWPKVVLNQTNQQSGDVFWEDQKQKNDKLVSIQPVDFHETEYRKAIGGVQIVSGDFARQYGYLNGFRRWLKPNPKPFGDFRDDVKYRRFCAAKGELKAIGISNLYRLRHTRVTYK